MTWQVDGSSFGITRVDSLTPKCLRNIAMRPEQFGDALLTER